MSIIVVETREGDVRTVEGREGLSLMRNLRDSGVDEIEAVCGGCCSCATCHVHVDPAWIDRLAPMGCDEDDLLDSSEDRDAFSRLSCQIPFTSALDGIRVRVAKED